MKEELETKVSRAWLLDFGRGLKASVGAHEMSQVLLSATLFELPCTPPYCKEVLIFQGRILPVLNLALLLEGQTYFHAPVDIVGIAAYQEDPTQPISYAGLHLAALPANIFVGDDQVCELPIHQHYWEPLILSCFYHEGLTIPILNLTDLFAGKLDLTQFAR